MNPEIELENFVGSIMEAGGMWTKFERASGITLHPTMKALHDKTGRGPFELWKNNIYQCAIYRQDGTEKEGWPKMIHLTVKRLDKKPIHDWRDLQRIKNELIGREHEAVELYPAESRLVDTANQYHLFVMADPAVRFPFGFDTRFVCEEESMGSKQRPFSKDNRPSDLKTFEQFAKEAGVIC